MNRKKEKREESHRKNKRGGIRYYAKGVECCNINETPRKYIPPFPPKHHDLQETNDIIFQNQENHDKNDTENSGGGASKQKLDCEDGFNIDFSEDDKNDNKSESQPFWQVIEEKDINKSKQNENSSDSNVGDWRNAVSADSPTSGTSLNNSRPPFLRRAPGRRRSRGMGYRRPEKHDDTDDCRNSTFEDRKKTSPKKTVDASDIRSLCEKNLEKFEENPKVLTQNENLQEDANCQRPEFYDGSSHTETSDQAMQNNSSSNEPKNNNINSPNENVHRNVSNRSFSNSSFSTYDSHPNDRKIKFRGGENSNNVKRAFSGYLRYLQKPHYSNHDSTENDGAHVVVSNSSNNTNILSQHENEEEIDDPDSSLFTIRKTEYLLNNLNIENTHDNLLENTKKVTNGKPKVRKLRYVDKKQYIKEKLTDQLVYSAKFHFSLGLINSNRNLSYKIDGKRNLLLAEIDDFIAEIQITDEKVLNLNEQFIENREKLLNMIVITNVLKDELLWSRNLSYQNFKNILNSRCSSFSCDRNYVEDILQIVTIEEVLPRRGIKYLCILEEILRNEYITAELRTATETLLNGERRLIDRNQYFPQFGRSAKFKMDYLRGNLKSILENGQQIHKENLLKHCKLDSYLMCKVLDISNLPFKKLLLINEEDLKIFAEISTLIDKEVLPVDEIISLNLIADLWTNFYEKINNSRCLRVKEFPCITHRIYVYLLKSFRDVILEISAKMKVPPQSLLENGSTGLRAINSIPWSGNSSVNDCFEKQLQAVVKLMEHYQPGSYSSQNKFSYEFKLLNTTKMNAMYDRLRVKFGLKIKPCKNLLSIHEERLVWLYILDCSIAPILGGYLDDHLKEIYFSLICGFVKFIQEAKIDKLELFRIATHNIIKFTVTIYPYFSSTNSASQVLDQNILKYQIDSIQDCFSSDDDLVSNHFTSLIDVYNEYWELRGNILEKLSRLHDVFKNDRKIILSKLLNIVEEALSKKVNVKIVVQFFRFLNEFLKQIKVVDFTWLIEEKIYSQSTSISKAVKKIFSDSNSRYEVTEPVKFITILKEKNIKIPKHYVIEVIEQLLDIINKSLLKTSWTDDHCLKACGELFLSIGHSFIFLKGQMDYIDFQNFLEDSVRPFESVVKNSVFYEDFKRRLTSVENFYLYARKQSEIGVATVLELCKNEVRQAEINGFSTSIDCKLLENCFNVYADKFKSLDSADIPTVLENIRSELKDINFTSVNEWTPEFKQNTLPRLLAGLATVWSIQESEDVASINKKIEPHCVQIVCILRLISADLSSNGIKKHFAQVLTGQGKSIILGLLAALFALTGHFVYVACYSEYLATRDEKEFQTFLSVFEEFDIENKISYITIGQMVEDVILTRKINGKNSNVRTLVDNFFSDTLQRQNIESSSVEKYRILLYDEADVVFSDNYYGRTFNPGSTIKVPALLEIQPKIWEIVENGFYDKIIVSEKIKEFINDLLKTEKYYDLKKMLMNNNKIFEDNLQEMISDAIYVSKNKKYDERFVQKYKIKSDGIIYQRDSLGIYSSSIRNSYYDVFYYFRLKKTEFEHKNFANYGYISIRWGKISYAKLPFEFNHILGVSGTLMTLSDYEKNAIKTYGIDTMSAMPSFFGKRKLEFDSKCHVTIEDDKKNWHSKIYSRIQENIESSKPRAVIVFFDTDVEVAEFEKNYRNNFKRLHTLTGLEEPSEIEWRVTEAGVSQTVTAASRAIGRGTDFKANDQSVENNGGVHVIQTFFSLDEKEQIQIQGRTARKDHRGSYEMILCREHLKSLNCDKSLDGNSVSCYTELDAIRKNLSKEKQAIVDKNIKEADDDHKLTLEFINSLSEYTPDKRAKYLSKYPFVKSK